MNNRAFSYIRFSSKQQARGDSLRRQLQAAQDYCHQHNLTLDDSSFRDLGVSAYKGHNTTEDSGLGQFLATCASGKVGQGDYLIIESLDRMSRQHVQTALRQFLNILSYGITLVTLMDGKKYDQQSDTTDLIISITIMARAYEESATKSKRLRASWDNKRQRMSDGTAVLKNTSLAPHWLKLSEDRTTWLVNKERASVIRLMYDLTVQGYGQQKLVQYLNENGYPAPKGNGWAASSVKRILTDKCVIGHYQPHEFIDGIRQPVGSVIEDYYTPIISEDTYYLVQSKRNKRRGKNVGRKGDRFTNLLQGIVQCECGSGMHMIDKGKSSKGGKYLVCAKARKGLDCSVGYVSYRYSFLETAALQQLLCQDYYHLLLTSNTDSDSEKNQITNNIASLESKLVDANNRLSGFLSLVSDFTAQSVKDEYSRQQASILALESAISEGKSALAELSETEVKPSDISTIFQLVADSLQTDLLTVKHSPSSSDDVYLLRLKLNNLVRDLLGNVTISKEYIKQSNQLIHCTSTNTAIKPWSIQVGRGAKQSPLWYLAGWAE
ncbi:recombinase family protein [Vibrio parahaemolyticus]|uniref:recombinase family protein n=1 Tax=Vibrio parahaemolyticus TaxID=670 RepID=UPI00329723F1